MPRLWAIFSTSMMADSTSSRSGSGGGLYCPILFIATFYKHRGNTNHGIGRVSHPGRFQSFAIDPRISALIGPAVRACLRIANSGISRILPECPGPVCSKVHTFALPDWQRWRTYSGTFDIRHPTVKSLFPVERITFLLAKIRTLLTHSFISSS